MTRTSRWLMPVLAAALFFGTIGAAQAAGWWVTSGRDAVVSATLTPSGLKGWMTLAEVADGLGLPLAEVVRVAGADGIPGVDGGTALKDVEDMVPGFDVGTFRDALEATLSAGSVADDVAGAPAEDEPSTPTTSAAPTPTRTPTGTPTGTPEASVRGSMTLLEVAEGTGVAVADLLAACDLPSDTDPGTALRDLRDLVPGFELQAVRDAVAALTAE